MNKRSTALKKMLIPLFVLCMIAMSSHSAVSLFAQGTTLAPACNPITNQGNCCDLYIGSFTTSGGSTNINNVTPVGQPPGSVIPQDFTSQVVTTTVGGSFSFTVRTRDVVNGWACGVYIDMNNNGIFQEAADISFQSGTIAAAPSPGNPFTRTVVIPGTALPGPKRIRVTHEWSGYAVTRGPCENSFYGRYHDYTLMVLGGPYESFPEDIDPRRVLAAGTVYNTQPFAPYLKARTPGNVLGTMTYRIVGPLPAGSQNVVYQALQNGQPNISYTPATSDYTFRPGIDYGTTVSGPYAGANGALDLTNAVGGRYRVESSINTPSTGLMTWDKEFLISFANDLAVEQFLQPVSNTNGFKYILGTTIPLTVQYRNVGLNVVRSFITNIQVIKDGVTRYQRTDTVRNLNLPLNGVYSFDFPPFAQANEIGTYSVQVCCQLRSVVINGVETFVSELPAAESNNCIPATGSNQSYNFEVAYETELAASSVASPATGFSVCANRPIRLSGNVFNNGAGGVAVAPVRMTIYDATNNPVFTANTIVTDVLVGQTKNVIFPQIWTPTTPGQYRAEFKINFTVPDPIPANDVVNAIFTVTPQLSGVKTVGVGGNYPNIQSAVDALYNCGIDAPITFELTDTSYTLGSLAANAPALDLTGSIIGASTTNTITWRPATARSYFRGDISINLLSGAGIGLLFGQSGMFYGNGQIASSNNQSAFLQFFLPLPDIAPRYANPTGNMKFDGGQARSIRFRLQAPTTQAQRAAIYFGRGSFNYSIENCLIEDGSTARSFASSLPLQVYNRTQNTLTHQLDIRTGNVTYSAGVVNRSTLPVNRLGSNVSNYDTLANQNIIIRGNEISGFGYGVASIGLGVAFRADLDAQFIPFYNSNTQIVNNVISNCARSGIFLGFENNATIRGNQIANIGEVTGVTYTGNANGIHIGGFSAFNNTNITVAANDISGVRSSTTADGIFFDQLQNRYALPTGTNSIFPKSNENFRVFNNVISDITRQAAAANVTGVHAIGRLDNSADLFRINGLQILNNTIVLPQESIAGSGYINAVRLQNAQTPLVRNNAIALLGTAAATTSHHVGIFYQGTVPGLSSDRNAFWTPNVQNGTGGPGIAYIVEANGGSILDNGDVDRFKNLSQWRAISGQDINSVYGNFVANHSVLTRNGLPILRVTTQPQTPIGSVLNNRGEIIPTLTTDIDGNPRGMADQRYDIGANEFTGRIRVADMEVFEISSPRKFRRSSGQFSDAQYVMSSVPAKFKVRFTNPASLPQINTKIVAQLFVESTTSNNSFVAASPVDAAVVAQPVAVDSMFVTVPVSAETEVEFAFGNSFAPQTYDVLASQGYTVPANFASMNKNVTPRYRLVVTAPFDENTDNNVLSADFRFYVRRSSIGMMVSLDGSDIQAPQTQNEISGRLNADSLLNGMNQIGYTYGDFDILERRQWEPNSVDFTSWKTLFWSHDATGLNRDERTSIRAFMAAGSIGSKKNLLIGSQEVGRTLSGLDVTAADRFVKEVLRVAPAVQAGNPAQATPRNTAPDFYHNFTVRGMTINREYNDFIRATGYSNGTITDEFPRPALYNMFSDANTEGTPYPAYRYNVMSPVRSDSGNRMGTAIVGLRFNTLHYGVDWRHYARTAGLEDRTGIQRFLRGALDWFEMNGGSVVPVELASFDARKVSATESSVEWASASEQNTARFEVQRREKFATETLAGETITTDFRTVASIPAAGNSTTLREYGVRDGGLRSTVYVYRLRMVDADGTSKNSHEVEVDMRNGTTAVAIEAITPNPAQDVVSVRLTANVGTGAEMVILDAQGREVRREAVRSNGTTLEINVRDLSAGAYTVRVGDATAQLRVVR